MLGIDYSTNPAPCGRCLELAQKRYIRTETVMPLPPGAMAPMPVDRDCGYRKHCFDCASAETLVRRGVVPEFGMARIAVGNCRQEQLRLPGVPLGLVQTGHVRPSEEGDLEKHHAWMDLTGISKIDEEGRV